MSDIFSKTQFKELNMSNSSTNHSDILDYVPINGVVLKILYLKTKYLSYFGTGLSSHDLAACNTMLQRLQSSRR